MGRVVVTISFTVVVVSTVVVVVAFSVVVVVAASVVVVVVGGASVVVVGVVSPGSFLQPTRPITPTTITIAIRSAIIFFIEFSPCIIIFAVFRVIYNYIIINKICQSERGNTFIF